MLLREVNRGDEAGSLPFSQLLFWKIKKAVLITKLASKGQFLFLLTPFPCYLSLPPTHTSCECMNINIFEVEIVIMTMTIL